jgi:hypothetical protein
MRQKNTSNFNKIKDSGDISSLNFTVNCFEFRSQYKCTAQILLHVPTTLLNLIMDFAISRQRTQLNMAARINSEYKLYNMR